MSEAYNLEHIASRKPKQNKEVPLMDATDLRSEVADAVKALRQELAELRHLLRAAGTAATISTDKRSA